MACLHCGNPKRRAQESDYHCEPRKMAKPGPAAEATWERTVDALAQLPTGREFYIGPPKA